MVDSPIFPQDYLGFWEWSGFCNSFIPIILELLDVLWDEQHDIVVTILPNLVGVHLQGGEGGGRVVQGVHVG